VLLRNIVSVQILHSHHHVFIHSIFFFNYKITYEITSTQYYFFIQLIFSPMWFSCTEHSSRLSLQFTCNCNVIVSLKILYQHQSILSHTSTYKHFNKSDEVPGLALHIKTVHVYCWISWLTSFVLCICVANYRFTSQEQLLWTINFCKVHYKDKTYSKTLLRRFWKFEENLTP
jgi:hypothetical protein